MPDEQQSASDRLDTLFGLKTTPAAQPAGPVAMPEPGSPSARLDKLFGLGAPKTDLPRAGTDVGPPVQAAPDFTKHLQENRHLDFVDRAIQPEKYPSISNQDGTISTHLMSSAEVNGQHIAYPNIVRRKGEDALTKLSPDEAVKYAQETGEHITFPSREAAEQFATGGYKEAAARLRGERREPSGIPEALAPAPPPTPQPAPEAPGEHGFLGEIGTSIARGTGGLLKMPQAALSAFGIKGGKGLAETGERLEREYPPSPSVAGGITEHPSLLVNPKWWASTMPSLAVQILPIAIAALGGEVVGGAAAGAYAGLAAGGFIGVSDAGQRMMDWEKEHNEELPAATKILIGLGAGTAGAVLPGKVLTKLVGAEGVAATEAISKIFTGSTGKAIADRAVRATYGGGAMAGFSVIENAFEKFGYNPDRELTQGVLESLILGTAVSGIHSEIGLQRKRLAEKGESARLDDYFKSLTLDLETAQQEAQNRVRTEYGGGAGKVIGEEPEVKPVLDQFGRPVQLPEEQAALAKLPQERNLTEKFLADRAQKEARGELAPEPGKPGPIVTPPAEMGRAQTGEQVMDRLQRSVDIIGEPNAAKQLNDILTLNQGDIVNAFRAPTDTPGIPEITDKITELAYKVEDTGDPGAAKELSDFIKSNLGALKGYPRWPVERITPDAPMGTSATAAEGVAAAPTGEPTPGAPRAAGADMVTRPAEPTSPAGRSNTTPTPPEAVALSESPPPKATPAPEPPSSAPALPGGGGTVGLAATPAGEKPAVPLPAPEGRPDAPMGTSGSAAEHVTPEAPPTKPLAPEPTAPPEALHAIEAAKEGAPGMGKPPPKEWVPPIKRSRTYDTQRAVERGDIDTLILAEGGFDSKSEIFKNFEPEERARLFRYMRSKEKFPTVKGPDVMFEDLKTKYPHLMPYENEVDWLRSIVQGEHKKFLMDDKIFEDIEAQHDYITREAEKQGVSPEELAKLEADAQRETAATDAAEREAIRAEAAGEPLPPGALEWDVTGEPEPAGIVEAAFGLKPKERPVSKLESRLDTLQADYPDIDRDRAAAVLRALPEAQDFQVAAMSADETMFNQVARGNLAASERAQLLKDATDLGKQMGLPGMGGETLFRAGEEAEFGRAVTTEDIKSRLGESGAVRHLASEARRAGPEDWRVVGADKKGLRKPNGDPISFQTEAEARDWATDHPTGWEIKMKNGLVATVFQSQDGSLRIAPKDILSPDYAALGITSLEGRKIAGAFTPMSVGGVIELARGSGPRVFDHESWHMIERWVLTDKELAKISKKFGDNEELRAEAYAKWDPTKAPDTVFQKILDFFKNIAKALTGYESAEDIFAKARSGEMFAREPVERMTGAKPKAAITAPLTESVEATKKRYEGVKGVLTRLFTPSRRSIEGLETHMSIAKAQAERDVEIKRIGRELQKYDGMTAFTDANTLEFLRLFQSGRQDQITDPTFRAFAEFIKEEDARQMRTMADYGKAPRELANHIDQLWMPGEARDRVYQAILNGTPLKGPDYFFNARTIPNTPLGIQMGLVPRFPTLAQTVLAGRSARESYIAAQKQLKDIKDAGRVKVVKSMRDTPEGWRRYPGSYGEVWTKVDRPGGLMVPREADERTLPLGASEKYPGTQDVIPGGERMGYEEVPGVKGWMRTGFRVGPEEVVLQFENFMGKGLKGNDIFELYQNSLYAVRHLQMALSGWHFFFEGINSMAGRTWSGLADTVGGLFTGDLRRTVGGLGQIVTAPAALPINMRQGLKFDKAIMNPKDADPHTLAVARVLVSGGTRAAADVNLKKIMAGHFKEAWQAGPLHPITATGKALQGLSAGLMEYVVPQGKNGQIYLEYLNEVKRFERTQGRAPTPAEELRMAYEVREHADNVWGAVANDNVAMNDTMKSLLSAIIQFPRFNIGSVKLGYRDIKGAGNFLMKAVDFARGEPIRKMEIQDRLALQYTAGLLFSVGMVGGLMHWAFTGAPPKEMADYFFPKTGEVLANGAEERLQLPSYLKDMMGVYKHPFRTISAKESTFIHIITDLIENKNYWGNQIYDPHDWAPQKGLDILKYAGKSVSPFVFQTFEQGQKQTLGRAALSFTGIRPVPREIANTPAQNVIDEYNQMMRASMTTKESADKKKLKSDLLKMARDQDEAGFQVAADQAVAEGNITRQQIKEIVSESQNPPGMSRFTRLPLEWALKAWDAGSGYEQEQWEPYLLKKVMAEKPENLIKNREAVVNSLRNLGLTDAAAAVAGLAMPEEGTGIDLTGLGVTKEAPEMGVMAAVDDAIATALEMKLADKTKPKKPTAKVAMSKKKHPYEMLGM